MTRDGNFVAPNVLLEVLQHIEQYKLTVGEAIKRLPSFHKSNEKLVIRTLRKMERQSFIGSAELHKGLTYWFLQPRGCKQLRLVEHKHGPLSEMAKFRAYAILHFCCLTHQQRRRLTENDFQQRLPEFNRPGLPSTYYFDQSGQGRLGFIRVDCAYAGRWDRIIQTIHEDVESHLRRLPWLQLINAGRFDYTLLTALPEKASRIRTSLNATRLANVNVQVIAVPTLMPLICIPWKELR